MAISLDATEAWIFDLDGVLTDTARLHLAAWTELFDDLFGPPDGAAGAGSGPSGTRRFSAEDYSRLVDGEPPADAVRNVLADRGRALPDGTPADPAGTSTVWALVNRKDARYLDLLRRDGPGAFPTSVDLLHRLRSRGVDVAVVSGSRHCAEVLAEAGLTDLVDVRVDGRTARAMGLPGKPDPALFLEAARRLGVEPARAVVVEDALAGVEAGRRGGFATVVGVDRTGHRHELARRGATVVVSDLGELALTGEGPEASPWRMTFPDPGPADEGVVETLCTLANGYLGTRGARPWAHDDGVSYPGTYLAGLYDRLDSDVQGQLVEVENLVNAPNWLPISFRARAKGGAWVGSRGAAVSTHRLRLDLRGGLVVRRCTVTDREGRRTAVVERRVVSMADPHLVALELDLVPLNWSGRLEVRAGIDGRVVADETEEERRLANRHLRLVDQGVDDPGVPWLRVRTVESQVLLALAARCRAVGAEGGLRRVDGDHPGWPQVAGSFPAVEGARLTVEKVVAVYTSHDAAIAEPGEAARRVVAGAGDFDDLVADHRAAWERLWRRASITISDHHESSKVLNLHLFHLLQVASPHVVGLDTGLGARGLHGEGYNGHVFWDSLFAFPVLDFRLPDVSRALLGYRSRRLPAARQAAAEAGYAGAMFPWQSGSDGRDETPSVLFNPRSGHWMPDRSRAERHVGLAIGYCVWQHWQATGDFDHLAGRGAELLFEIARYFSSLAADDDGSGRFHIRGVMGPDEFHDGYPWEPGPGLTDNAYTNVMAAWLLWRAGEVAELLRPTRADTIERLGLEDAELARWETVSRGLAVPFHEGVVSQFAGYERLEPLDLDAYRARYGNIGRLDLILEAEGDTVRRYQVGKQADVLMLLYLLSAEELRAVFDRLGYPLAAATIRRTVEYYSNRVTHGSTLSTIVHAWVLARADRRASWRYFRQALASDVADVQGGTTREGIHLAAMAGTADLVQRCYTGLEVRGEALWFNPMLPPELRSLRFDMRFRGVELEVDVDHRRLRVTSVAGHPRSASLMLAGEPVSLAVGQSVEVRLTGHR